MGRKKHTQEEALQLRALTRDWKIDFESVTTLGDWDAKNLPSRNIFKQILEIKTVAFVDYPAQDHSDKEAAVQKKLLVRRLQANAARCRSEKDNEAGWVNNVANVVFGSLNGFEFRWYVAHSYGFLILSLAQRIRSQPSDCLKIIVHARSVDAVELKGQLHYGLENVTLDQKYKRPDRVFGLSITRSFDRFRDRLATFSPFSGKHTLFPFMVVEAKSEKSEAGFHDIEQQTALSIRTCLKIQTDLEMESRQVIDPLVWFFGFRGDEWRLYVALPVYERTKVIDCWHGCISNTNEALQLLLIVDWICFWARDVHRKGILKCLSGLEARETTPAVTLLSSQGASAVGPNPTRSRSLVVRSSRPAEPTPEVNAQPNLNGFVRSASELEDELMQDALNESSDHEGGEGDLNAVRSSLDVAFRWKYFAFPEDDTNMLECLRSLATGGSIQSVARGFWEIFTDKHSTVKMSLKAMSNFLLSATKQDATDSSPPEPVSIFLACQHRLTETSWQVMCTYWCITCSQRAAQLLAEIAGIADAEVYALNLWRAHDCNCLTSAIADFQKIGGKASAAAAISQDIYCVRASTSRASTAHVKWFKCGRDIAQRRVAMLEALYMHAEGSQHSSLPAAISRASVGDVLLPSELFATDDLDKVPGVILRKPKSWPATCPLWCFLTFERGTRESIGQQITLAHQRGAIYAEDSLEPSDEQSISEWALTMKDVMQSVDASHH